IQITESYGSSINRKVELQTNGGTLDLAEGVELTLAGDINGAGALTKAGAGTLELTNANTYAGGTTISQGVVNLSGAGSLGAGNVEIVNGAVLNFNHEGDATFNNSVSGSGTIYKNGSGTLRILNETPDNFTVESFVIKVGELDFKGYFKGILKVGSGAKFSPGNSVGKLTQDGTFILDSGSLLLIEQDSEGIDEIMAKEFNIDNGAVIEMSMGAVIPGAQYTLFTKTSGENFVDAYATDEFWNSLLTPESAYYWNLSVKDNVVYAQLDASAVPEPSTWALLILGAAGLLYWRKKNS
ncbi:MAG: autotransporter-associated beta strand repeat-containing protein, partial [Thermoguttaceae bacterium]|nr:autotransporter-associated beta strand repeat-containing protein [Thermoguttaceae bacterium]